MALLLSHTNLANAAGTAQLVALGDSYMSAGSVASTQLSALYGGQSCRQAYDDVAHLVAPNFPQLAFADYSRGGAVTPDISGAGTGRGPQISGLSPATRAVMVSIGGNDTGFGEIISSCVRSATCTPDKRAEFDARMRAVNTKLGSAYAAIHRTAPNAHVFTVGYLKILPQNTAGCFTSALIDQDTMNHLNGLEYRLNGAVVAESGRVGFVPVIPTTAGDHSICAPEGQRYVSLTGTGPGEEGARLHPTLAGRQHVAQLVAAAVQHSGIDG